MKCEVLYDKQGNIIAARFLERPTREAYDLVAPRSRMRPQEGQHVAELEVPEEYARLELIDLVERLQVDVQAKRPTFVAKKL